MIDDIKTCVAYGKQHGVIVGLQNHNDFIKTPAHVHYIMERVNDEWFGLINDTGGFRNGDPYADTREVIKYSVNWQLKEKLFINSVEADIDLCRMIDIIKKSDYNGYIPIETLGDGDPKIKVKAMIEAVRRCLNT
jgi:sugar phosphate isomerase/epimerase